MLHATLLADIDHKQENVHNEFDGTVGVAALQLSSHAIVPVVVLVIPQAFAVDILVQLLPRVAGFAGVVAVQAQAQLMVPVFVAPQEFAVDVQEAHTLAAQQAHKSLVQETVLVSLVQFHVRVPQLAKLSVSASHHTQVHAVVPQTGSV